MNSEFENSSFQNASPEPAKPVGLFAFLNKTIFDGSLLSALLINGFIWGGFLLLIWNSLLPLGMFLMMLFLPATVVATSIGTIVLHFAFLKQREMNKLLKYVIYELPSILLLLYIFVIPKEQDINRTQGNVSPSGKYVLYVINEQKEGAQHPYWRVTIKDPDGNLLFKDDDSQFIGYFSAYWCWDNDDRIWFYNGDTGGVYFWEEKDGQWAINRWGNGRKKDADNKSDVAPPEVLYPDYE